MSKIHDTAWPNIISALNLSLKMPNGVSEPILADDIKAITKEEPRKVCYIDNSKDLPPILKTQRLFPLPVTNGEYRLVKGVGYHELEPIGGPVKTFTSKLDFELTTAKGQGESMFLHYAFNSGLISEFSGIDDLRKGSEGRNYATAFKFWVGKSGPINQDGSQMQVDGLFEGRRAVFLMEVKTKNKGDFIIRQLYYPMRHYGIVSKKSISNAFLVVDPKTKIYSFWQYSFKDGGDYESINLIKSCKYKIVEKPHTKFDLEKITPDNSLGMVQQADSIEVIQKVPVLISGGTHTSDELAQAIGYVGRQGNYYGQAAELLGLINRKMVKGGYSLSLTDIGERFVSSRPDERNELLATQIMRIPIMNMVLKELIQRADSPSRQDARLTKDDVARMIEENSHLKKSTPGRRAGSIMSWYKWISQNYGVVQVMNGEITLHRQRQEHLDDE